MQVDFVKTLPDFGDMAVNIRQGASLEKLAQEFEAIMVTQMLQVMRESVGSSGLFEDAPGKDLYMGMMDQEVARALVVQGGGFGLAQHIRQALERRAQAPSPGAQSLEGSPVTSGIEEDHENELDTDKPKVSALD